MEIPFLHLKTNERNTVPQPEGIELFRAALWLAAGMVGISFLATSLPMKFKLILDINFPTKNAIASVTIQRNKYPIILSLPS